MSDEARQSAGPPDRAAAGWGAAPAGSPALDQAFDADSLYALRAAVAAHAAAADLSPQRVYDVVAAAHELAANSVVHGPGHGRLRLWAADGFLYCQVSDDGSAESTRARRPAEAGVPWRTTRGHGLWVVGQVSDKLSVDRGRSGTTVTAGFAIAPLA
jgi:anti-sigma regulatory factor (Ser/Thr protein kinase)